MYRPSHFKVDEQEQLVQFISENPFAILVTAIDQNPLATQIPMEMLIINNEFFLLGHVSAANPQGKTFNIGATAALAIFTAGHTYVSSSWYEKENVSTWNYRSVQVKGIIKPLLEDDLRAHLIRMQAKYESTQTNPRTVETMSEGYFEKQVKGVLGFKMEIDSIEGSWKLSQNRNEKDFNNIIEQLDKLEDPNAKEISNEMSKLCKR